MKLSDRYITDRFLPDKAIDVMDEAGSRARIGTMTRPPEVKDMEAEIEEIKAQKERAIKDQDFEGAAAMRDKEKQAKEKLDAVLADWRASREEKRVIVGRGGHFARRLQMDRHSAQAHGGRTKPQRLLARGRGNGAKSSSASAKPSPRCARRCAVRARI